MGIVRRRVGKHQFDETENHRKVVAQSVNGGGITRDRAGWMEICTQFSGRAIMGRDSRAELSLSHSVNVGQTPTSAMA